MNKKVLFLLVFAGLVAAGPARAYDCTAAIHDAAYAEMDRYFKQGILRYGGDPASVLMVPAAWAKLDFVQKQAFVDRLVCVIAGAGKGMAAFTVRSVMTGKSMGDWHAGTLTVP